MHTVIVEEPMVQMSLESTYRSPYEKAIAKAQAQSPSGRSRSSPAVLKEMMGFSDPELYCDHPPAAPEMPEIKIFPPCAPQKPSATGNTAPSVTVTKQVAEKEKKTFRERKQSMQSVRGRILSRQSSRFQDAALTPQLLISNMNTIRMQVSGNTGKPFAYGSGLPQDQSYLTITSQEIL